MEREDKKKQTPDNRDGNSTTTQTDDTDNTPVTNQRTPTDQTSGDIGHISLDRPWVDREHVIGNTLKNEHWWKTNPQKGDALERWSTQPVSDGPYQNIMSVVSKTQTKRPDASSDDPPKQPVPISEIEATSGSR